MKKNMGSADRIIRIIAAIAIVMLMLTGQISGIVGIVLGVLAVVFIATSAVGSCPLYLPFKFSTKKEVSAQS